MTTNKESQDGQLTINNHDNFAVVNVSRSYDLLRKGMSDEKEFTRETFNQIQESVTEMENVCNKDMAKLAENLSGIDRNVKMMENQFDKLKEYQQEMNRKLELERQSTMEKYRAFQVQMNEEIEKASKRDVLDRPSSCMDLFRNGITSSGVYTLYHQMQTFIVFCLFKKEGGYTFIYPEILIEVDINSLSNDNSHVLIRHRRTNGVQYESRIEQITRYQSRPISVQYNSHVAYQGPVNSLMTPYIYVGLTPEILDNGRNHKGDTQGYRSNGQDVTFVNCDGNPNGYFAFLFNHNSVAPSSWYSPALARQWVDTAIKVTDEVIPDKFLSFFELHFGGCGVFASTDRIQDVTGAAVGIPFKL